MDLGATVISEKLVQKFYEGLGVEDLDEPRMPLRTRSDSDCTHHFDALANRWAQDLESNAHESPCSDDGAGLLKHRFVLIEGYAVLLFGFFLMAGSSSSIQVCCAFSSALDNSLPGYCTEKRIP
jgi:hypothetical protein